MINVRENNTKKNALGQDQNLKKYILFKINVTIQRTGGESLSFWANLGNSPQHSHSIT